MASKPQYLNTQQLMRLFGVSHLTIYTWRKGTATREALPCHSLPEAPRNPAFKPAEVKAWAKRHGVNMTCEPASLVGVTQVKKKADMTTAKKASKPVAKAIVAKDSNGKVVKVPVKAVVKAAVKKPATSPATKSTTSPTTKPTAPRAKLSAVPVSNPTTQTTEPVAA